MSGPVEVPPVLVIISIISLEDQLKESTRILLESIFGKAELASPLYPFDLSDYYEEEMGPFLSRRWYCFSKLKDASELAEWKYFCESIENSFLDRKGNRKVNIDPGYLDYGKLVLASFKSAPDKIYMGRGIWAHTCLRYGHGSFMAPDHSFPDFKDGRFDDFMLEARRLYRRMLKQIID
ncbi:MAG: DUF4416 family protein [Candidatus Aegiribacteria sp.]|nr:DUF4416 family protein [Candidatus Aegiribacteria sp.]